MVKQFYCTFLLCAGMLLAGKSVSAKPVTELPLKEVVLYSSGVGAFTHQGRISENTSVRFQMSKKQLNDLLKSLYVTASGKDTGIRSVTYPTELPVDTLMEGYRIDLTKVRSLTDILRQWRGESFELTIAGATKPVKGKLISVETQHRKTRIENETRFETLDYAVMLTDKGIQRFSVSGLTSIIPLDKTLLAEMTKVLAVISEQRDQTSRTIDVNLNLKKPSDVRIAYIIEAPVWKASYRLELMGKKANLQGWALVENPTRAEWKNVTLSLISGCPESFVQDLYTSLYLPRPVVQRENHTVPFAYKSSPHGKKSKHSIEACCNDNIVVANRMTAGTFRRINSNIPVEQKAMGELFCYRIARPVTLDSRQSAMLEFVSTTVNTKKISFYSMLTPGKHPLNAVLLKNNSGLLLPQGPVTIFEGKNYGGDASLSDLPSGQDQILRYGIDLELQAIPANPEMMTGQITDLVIDRGILKYSTKQRITYRCVFENKSPKDKVILLEIPRSPNAAITSKLKPFSETAEGYRFMIPAKARNKVIAEVSLMTPVVQTCAVNANTDFSRFVFASTNAELAPESKKLAEKLMNKSRIIKNLEQELKDLEEKIRDLTLKHERTRKSINANVNVELRTRLNRRLAETDDELDKLDKQKESVKGKLRVLRKDFNDFLARSIKN